MFDDVNDLYQQVILDHCRKPHNFRELPNPSCSAQGHNPLCGDQLRLCLRLENNLIQDIAFLGSGCCISKASASLLTQHVKGLPTAAIRPLFDRVHAMMTTGHAPEDLGKLGVFAGVHKYPARVKCAILPWHALLAALEHPTPQTVSTETDPS